MREYIEREKLLTELRISADHHAQSSREESLLYRDRNIVREQPTITEQEIIKSYLDKLKAIIRQWYWNSDVQKIATDPCVVDALIDMFIRTIDKILTDLEEKDV